MGLDQLTGLPNRIELIENLSLLIEEKNREFTLILLNINRFQYVNASFGYEVGDKLLQKMSRYFSGVSGLGVRFYRTNGDEFYVVAEDEKDAYFVMDAIESLFTQPFYIQQREFYVSFRAGVVHYPLSGNTVNELLTRAQFALHEAKRDSHNVFKMYEEQFFIKHDRVFNLETKLKYALQTKSFELYHQPKYDLRTDEIIGTEALIRLFDPEIGFIPPDEFIPFAEESGLIYQIGDWVIREACQQIKHWNKTYGLELTVAVNLPSKQLMQPDFVNYLTEIFEEYDIDPKYLEIEITERILLEEDVALVQKLRTLNEMGIKIAIDDFGTGYSCLSYLQHFPLDIIKIDRCFTQYLKKGQETIVQSTIALAHALNVTVVAEGIEMPEQLDILKQLNCDFGQGYFLNRPMPAVKFEEYLSTYQAKSSTSL